MESEKEMNTMNVHQSNLISALRLAIQDREKVEKAAGYTFDSGFTGGLKEVLKHVEAGGQLNILPSN